jgi:MerR family copper efflux transcriptional regulator
MVQSKGLRSGTLAKAAEVSPDTIRNYEKIGVLPRAARTVSGYRVYPASAVERVLVVQRALRIGFTLAELAEVLKARDAGGVPCQRVYELAQGKLKGIEADIKRGYTTLRIPESVVQRVHRKLRKAG